MPSVVVFGRVVEDRMTERQIQCQDFAGGPREWILEARKAFAVEFDAEVSDTGKQKDVWQQLLENAADRDTATLPGWMRHGFPLGVKKRQDWEQWYIPSNRNRFCRDGWLQDDIDGAMTNYSSFEEAGDQQKSCCNKWSKQVVQPLRVASGRNHRCYYFCHYYYYYYCYYHYYLNYYYRYYSY